MEWYAPPIVLDPELLRPERVRPLKRAEYDRLVEAGVFEDEKVELLRGMLVTMSPQGVPHFFPIEELTERLVLALTGRARVRVQGPLAATDDSEPEPDIAVVEPVERRREHPSTALLVVEVAVSSVRKDMEVKAAIYAEASVVEYWVIDVSREKVVRFLEPRGGVYSEVSEHGRGEGLALRAFPDVEIALDAILP